jgi:hypothetical protein
MPLSMAWADLALLIAALLAARVEGGLHAGLIGNCAGEVLVREL